MSKKKANGSAALASALESAMEEAVERVVGPRFSAMEEAISELKFMANRQNETLRMIWRQSGGDPKQHLPIDAE